MAKVGKRYPLLIYEHTLNRWYPATFALSIILFIFWWFQPVFLKAPPKNGSQEFAVLMVSGLSLLMTIFFFLMRKAAYVRAYGDHLRLVTPFLRMNISYKRIIKTRATEMSTLFQPSKLSTMRREAMGSLLSKTAIVVDLTTFPIPLPILRFFLSPFFFKDKTPHLVLLIDKWMSFSTEIESLRSGGTLPDATAKDSISSILSSISRDE
ncbi:MAG: hypothetical protein HN736_04820 [Anaerolineae bacterium]|nr:hypothetical protein [Anaerolineae bacterium]MBT3712210.1 hypothetical protein [Anaerolineae bacterium]MBT4310059.1 hypothetical protein [Anaerolineae bacterium]MBT4457598.1 hypothetical protein [Anaerolineae bacterium]MBT4841093.1 hypothetical protein [Anaerolineae bacterium]